MVPTYDPKDWRNHIWRSESVFEMINQTTETLKLRSEDNKHTAVVHKELLCFFSPYFAAALKSGFAEAGQDSCSVNLNEGDLKCLTTWLYTGRVFVPMDESLKTGVILRLYVFADQTKMLAFRRDIISVLMAINHLPKYEAAVTAFSNLPQSAPMCKYMVDRYVNHWGQTKERARVYDDLTITEVEKNVLAESMFQVADGLADRNARLHPFCVCCYDVCNYHEHESEDEWKATCGTHADGRQPTGGFNKP